MTATTHRVWKFGDNVNTDVIYSGRYTYTITERSEMAQYAMEDLDPAFAKKAQSGDVIVAGRNWGNGSSREQAVIALVELGIKAIIAESFARIYYRNAINEGLLMIQCPEAVPYIESGDEVLIDVENATLTVGERSFSFPRLPESVQKIVQAGGLISYLKQTYHET
ncbi:MAG: 3-isopropylmalate dehydratase [Chloroflexota bacterium]